MRLKLLFVIGLGVGYILGARAGRPRYEQIRAKVTGAWQDPRTQRVVADTQDFVKTNAPIVQDKVIAGTKVALAGAQDVAEHVADFAKDATKVTKDASKTVAKSAKDASKTVTRSAKDASKKVTKSAKKATETVAKTAKDAMERIIDRGEEVVDSVIIAVGSARDEALEGEDEDEDDK